MTGPTVGRRRTTLAGLAGFAILMVLACGTGSGNESATDKEEKTVEKLLREALEDLSYNALDRAVEMGDDAVPVLEEYLGDKNEDLRALAVECLSLTGGDVDLLLCKALGDPADEVREKAADALGQDMALPACRDCFRRHLASKDGRVRELAAVNLGMLDDPALVSDIQRRIDDEPNPDVREAMILALVRLGSKGYVAEFLAGLDSDIPHRCYETIRQFEYVNDPGLVVHLRGALDDVTPAFNVGTKDHPQQARICDAAVAAVVHFHAEHLAIDEPFWRVFTDEEIEAARGFLDGMGGSSGK